MCPAPNAAHSSHLPATLISHPSHHHRRDAEAHERWRQRQGDATRWPRPQHLCRVDGEAARQAHSNTNQGGTKGFAPPLTCPLHPNTQPPPFTRSSALLSLKPHVSLLDFFFFSVLLPFCQELFHQPHFPAGWVTLLAYPVYE